MKKSEAIQLFGSQSNMARALGITRQAVWQWPEDLSMIRTDWVRGAAMRLGIEYTTTMSESPLAPSDFGQGEGGPDTVDHALLPADGESVVSPEPARTD